MWNILQLNWEWHMIHVTKCFCSKSCEMFKVPFDEITTSQTAMLYDMSNVLLFIEHCTYQTFPCTCVCVSNYSHVQATQCLEWVWCIIGLSGDRVCSLTVCSDFPWLLRSWVGGVICVISQFNICKEMVIKSLTKSNPWSNHVTSVFVLSI